MEIQNAIDQLMLCIVLDNKYLDECPKGADKKEVEQEIKDIQKLIDTYVESEKTHKELEEKIIKISNNKFNKIRGLVDWK